MFHPTPVHKEDIPQAAFPPGVMRQPIPHGVTTLRVFIRRRARGAVNQKMSERQAGFAPATVLGNSAKPPGPSQGIEPTIIERVPTTPLAHVCRVFAAHPAKPRRWRSAVYRSVPHGGDQLPQATCGPATIFILGDNRRSILDRGLPAPMPQSTHG